MQTHLTSEMTPALWVTSCRANLEGKRWVLCVPYLYLYIKWSRKCRGQCLPSGQNMQALLWRAFFSKYHYHIASDKDKCEAELMFIKSSASLFILRCCSCSQRQVRSSLHTSPASVKAVSDEQTHTWYRRVIKLPPESWACFRSDTDYCNELCWSISAHIPLKWNVIGVMLISRVHQQCTGKIPSCGALHVMFPFERLHITFKYVLPLLQHHALDSRGFIACVMSLVGDVSIQTAALLCVFAGQFGKVWTISGIIWARLSV